jgi:hypothetical protein
MKISAPIRIKPSLSQIFIGPFKSSILIIKDMKKSKQVTKPISALKILKLVNEKTVQLMKKRR